MVEGTGLENRQTGNGFEGSNPSLSAGSAEGAPNRGSPRALCPPRYDYRMLLSVLLAAQQPLPEACLLSGLCNLVQPAPPVAPGVLFVAVGLVSVGVWGLRRRRTTQ